MTQVLDGESLDEKTVAALERSPAFVADSDLPRCDKGCIMKFADRAGGRQRCANGGGSATSARRAAVDPRTCPNSKCEYDMCLRCAGLHSVDFQVWPEELRFSGDAAASSVVAGSKN